MGEKMIGSETYICESNSQIIVHNNTIVISPRNEKDVTTSLDMSCVKRCESYNELPPPVFCSTPKSKGISKNDVYQSKRPTPISAWLEELRDCYSPECTTTLQSKSLMIDVNEKVKMLATLSSKVIRTLHHQTYSVAKKIDHIYRCLEMNCIKFIPGLVDDLVNDMVAILLQHSKGYLDLQLYHEVANQTAGKLEQGQLPHLVWQLNSLALDFSKRIDKLLLHQMEVLIGVMNTVENPTALMSILCSFAHFGLQCDHLGSLLSRCDGIATLLQIGRESSNSLSTRVLALKFLSSILCAPSAIMYMSEHDGVEQLIAILSENNRPLMEKRHVMSAIAQLSDPKYNVRISSTQIGAIIREETKLIKHIPCSQTLFLATVTFANFSSRKESVEPLIENSTIAVLLSAIRNQRPDTDLVLMDKATTIIANLSKSHQAIPYLCQNRVVPALLFFMNTELNDVPNEDSPDYWLQHKCALALARLCTEEDALSQIEQLKGVNKLLMFCKQSVNKNSDHRSLACLEAIKKILAKSNTNVLHASQTTQRLSSITIC